MKVSPTLRSQTNSSSSSPILALRFLDPEVVIAPVGDGAAGEVDQPEHPLPAVDGVVDPVQGDARLQLPEPRVGVPPGEHLQDEIELPPRELAVGVAGPDESEELVDVPAFDAGHGDDHLRQDVERALDGQDGFDVLLRHPPGDDGGAQKIMAVGGEEEAAARAADAVAGAPDALDRRRDRGGRLR